MPRVVCPPPPRMRAGSFSAGRARLEVAVLVWETHDAVRVGGVEKLRVGPGRVEGQAEGFVQAALGVGEEFLHVGRVVALGFAQDHDFIRPGLGHENIAVGGGEEETGVLQAARVFLDLETGRHVELGVGGARNELGAVDLGFRGVGRGEFLQVDPVPGAGGIVGPIARHLGEFGGGLVLAFGHGFVLGMERRAKRADEGGREQTEAAGGEGGDEVHGVVSFRSRPPSRAWKSTRGCGKVTPP